MSDELYTRERVVCMVRGGEPGREAQAQAINYALAHDCSLIFVHVVDLPGFPLSNEELREPARDELAWLGRVILAMARRRAQSAGVRAETLILFGSLFEQMENLMQERPARRIYVGAPHPSVTNYVERMQRVQAFADRLSRATGVPVVLTEPPMG